MSKSGVKMVDLSGRVFGMLTVVSLNRYDPNYRVYHWNCICSCGTPTVKRASAITGGYIQSCGCIMGTHKESVRGSNKGSKEYRAWKNIKQRCYNVKLKVYKNYGARGIKMCDRWINSYENFLSDIGRAPSSKHTIERNDNDKGYSPDNCKWATRREQVLNRRNSRIVKIGNESKPLADWCIQFNKNYYHAYDSLCRGHGSPENYFYGNKI